MTFYKWTQGGNLWMDVFENSICNKSWDLADGKNDYRQTSNISQTKSLNLNVSCHILQLTLPNPLKPCVESRMKM